MNENEEIEANSGVRRVVLVVPEDSHDDREASGISFLELWRILWQGKWIIAVVGAASFALAVAYVLLAQEWYTAEVILAPAEERSADGLAGQLGGLAGLVGLAGISVGGGNTAEPLAMLQSRRLLSSFIDDNQLLPTLFWKQWDQAELRWSAEDPDDWPDVRDGVKYLLTRVLSISQDPPTGLVTLSVLWTDPETAADWANELVERVNSSMRQRAIENAEANIRYLEETLVATSLATMQQSIGGLLETELQKLMLAKGNREFSFKVIDPAIPPKDDTYPRGLLIAILAVGIGVFLTCVVLIVRRAAALSEPAQ